MFWIIPIVFVGVFIFVVAVSIFMTVGTKRTLKKRMKNVAEMAKESMGMLSEIKKESQTYCEYCGSALNGTEKKCSSCGAKISKK